GEQFETFSQHNGRIGGNEVCAVFEDSQGNIWFSSEGYGVYRYDGTSLKNFRREQGLLVGAVQAIAEDSKGRIWVGGGGGLYRLEGESFINIIKDGPWD
ncbi:MAG: two-component regulator propeller domain-containing protein, partial [Bacteroidota bacterium]